MTEAAGQAGDTASSLPTGLDFRLSSTGIKRLQTAYPIDLNDQIYKQGYHPSVPTSTSSLWNRMFAESVNLMVCVAIIFQRENRDLHRKMCNMRFLKHMFSVRFTYGKRVNRVTHV